MKTLIRSNRGSAVAIVLLILAVTSLIGLGALTQSRLDVRMTSSISNYHMKFGLADGAATVAYYDLKMLNRDMKYDKGGQPWIYCKKGDNWDGDDIKNISTKAGTYSSKVKCTGASTDPTAAPGWEIGEFYPEYWLAEGEGTRAGAYGGVTAYVHCAVVKLKKKN
jgi:hypothetical protein